jgi:hypothetical protein
MQVSASEEIKMSKDWIVNNDWTPPLAWISDLGVILCIPVKIIYIFC